MAAWISRLRRHWGRALRRRWLLVRIHQVQHLAARPDLWHDMGDGALIDARLAQLRCELYTLDLQP